jgi:hypothetical protein
LWAFAPAAVLSNESEKAFPAKKAITPRRTRAGVEVFKRSALTLNSLYAHPRRGNGDALAINAFGGSPCAESSVFWEMVP